MSSPAVPYLHVLSGLAKRPDEEHVDKARAAICDSHEAIANSPKHHCIRLMPGKYAAREAFLRSRNIAPEQPPRLMFDARMNTVQISSRGPFPPPEGSISLTSPSPGPSTTGSTAVPHVVEWE
ncbi:hypothetical protein BDBG_01327 [Blastomyces gilchristii SLH14081]|uniref:Uncharacterized protein n=1 Tax=Blastomyces gilchristii (strain SLH14081) TaxID=559298 RepID=A0A179UE82_BLAGS|nr:uncharacterized protein BDBG_01327 [Blastomyces gilchristii SLH14081]EQL33373.1 hypothetical protein BDFG_04528 [Blastomyces dermatitidis ATCC 26199]OAT04832.1 hypothetical protein BDBG_01327 [Blastomyces gilchristii SLH14081]